MNLTGHDNYQKVYDNDGHELSGGARTNKRLSMIKWDVFKGKRVLDIGCNSGMLSFAAKNAGASYVLGIDAKPVIKVAQEAAVRRGIDIDFKAMDMESDEFKQLAKDGGFEITFFCAMYNHVKPENRIKMVQFIDSITAEVLIFETNFERKPEPYLEILRKYTTFDKYRSIGQSGDRKPEDYNLFQFEKHRNEPLEANRLPVMEVPISDVHFPTAFYSWTGDKKEAVQKRIDELKASIEINGQVKPCLVLTNTNAKVDKPWVIREGGKRYLAIEQLGLPTIRVRNADGLNFKGRTDL